MNIDPEVFISEVYLERDDLTIEPSDDKKDHVILEMMATTWLKGTFVYRKAITQGLYQHNVELSAQDMEDIYKYLCAFHNMTKKFNPAGVEKSQLRLEVWADILRTTRQLTQQFEHSGAQASKQENAPRLRRRSMRP